MRYYTYLSSCLLLVGMTALLSCDKEDIQVDDTATLADAATTAAYQANVRSMNLNSEFALSEATYEEFIQSLAIAPDGKFRGAIFDKIEEELNDDESDRFWSNFGFTIPRAGEPSTPLGARSDPESRVYPYYRPRPRGCKANRRWICQIHMV